MTDSSGTGRDGSSVAGAVFETSLIDCLERALGELRMPLLEAIRQPSGTQHGKDLQLRWIDRSGRPCVWHIEAKNWKSGRVPLSQVLSKLVEAARAPHDIDVWCLALAYEEPAEGFDEHLAAEDVGVHAPFAVTVLSGERGRIRKLFACFPDLFERVFPDEAVPIVDRELVLEGFGRWLEDATESGRRRSAPPGWTRVSPRHIAVAPNRAETRALYLRGWSGTCPWEAVVHGWAVQRLSAKDRLLRLIGHSDAGVRGRWIRGAGGEGKSTLLKQVAWDVAEWRDTVVLMAGAESGETADAPAAWLRTLPRGHRVLLCVDRPRAVTTLEPLWQHEASLREHGLNVFLLVASRGFEWHWGRRALGADKLEVVDLQPLNDTERAALVDRLDEGGLLHGKSRADALERLAHAAASASTRRRSREERPWLAPTLMRLTDPADRPFERILLDVLLALVEEGYQSSVQLLLGVSLVDASGGLLPEQLARRVVAPASFGEAQTGLLAELERGTSASLGFGLDAASAVYATHGQVVADGLVRVAAADAGLRPSLLELCAQLPAVMAPEYTAQDLLPKKWFDLLDRAADYLQDQLGDYECAVTLLGSWYSVDPTAFPALHRMGEATRHWLLHPPPGSPPAEILVSQARAAFLRALEVIEAVLVSDVESRAAPYRAYDRPLQEAFSFQGLAALEAALGTRFARGVGASDAFHRAQVLVVASLRRPRRETLGLLAQMLFHAGLPEDSAAVAGALRAATSDRNRVVVEISERLAAVGQEIPRGGRGLLDGVVARIASRAAIPESAPLGYQRLDERLNDLMCEALRATKAWIGDDTPQIDDALAGLSA